jgi:hypothetical protein
MTHRSSAIILTCVAIFNATACSGPNLPRTNTIPVLTSDASVVPIDVSLLGLPPLDVQTSTDASVEAANVFATPGNHNGENIVPLRQNERAPFNGVLFNGPAIARITVEHNAQEQRCLIERNHDTNLLTARYNADIDTMRLAIETQQRTDQVLLNGRDQDIARLNRLLVQASSTPNRIWENLAWIGVGALTGILTLGGIILFR